MVSIYCLKCKKHTGNKNEKVLRTKNNRLMMTAQCTVCGSRKNRFIGQQEASGLLSSLGVKTPLSKIPLLGDILF